MRVFKCGPDFLDPQILAVASGAPVENLDLWMCGPADGAARLYEAASQADLILVEGVMGLYDGTPSSADIAGGIPARAACPVSGQRAGAVQHTLSPRPHGRAGALRSRARLGAHDRGGGHRPA